MSEIGKNKLIFLIILTILISLSFSGCVNNNGDNEQNNNHKESGTKVFRVFCGNSDNVTHKVVLNIFDENNTEIDSLTDSMEPEKSKELYREVLPDQEYLVKVYVDNNWNGSIKHRPQSLLGSTPGSWISLTLGNNNNHGMFIKYIE